MAEVRSLSVTEVSALGPFDVSYTSQEHLRLRTSGEGAEIKWSLAWRRAAHQIVRHLEGSTISQLEGLYGPAASLSFIGALDQGSLVGRLTWKHEAWNRMVWLCDVRVRPEFQRRGVGTGLLRELQWTAARLEARGIMLETQTSNSDAIRFYLHHGFELVGLNSGLYGRTPEVALFFLLPLE